jgi:hypothetical protein
MYFLFWYFGIITLKNPSSARFQSSYAWDESFPILTRLKNNSSPSSIPILFLIFSWIYPGPISLPSRSCLYSDFTPALVFIPVPFLSLSRCGSIPIPIPILSESYPVFDPDVALVLSCSGQKENLVSFQVSDALWLSLDNDFPNFLEEYLLHMTCDNLTFDRNLRRTCKLLFLRK